MYQSPEQSNNLFKQVLAQSLQDAYALLEQFAKVEDFAIQMRQVFGNNYDVLAASSLIQDWTQGDFTKLPSIEILEASQINGANGAFAEATNTIYLSQEFFSENVSNPQVITKVLLEEIGHYIDSRINSNDALGDEGEIFASVVRGQQLSQSTLQTLKQEDDSALISLNGQLVEIEQSTSNYTPFGSEFRVDTATSTGRVTSPEIATAANGDFVVVWSTPFSTNDTDIYLRRFNADGTPKDSFDRAVATSSLNQFDQTVAMAADGSFVVAWTEIDSTGDSDVYFQRYDSAGNVLGSAVEVAAISPGKEQLAPDIAMFDNGDFVVTWTEEFSATDLDVRMRGFRRDGTAFTGDLGVATSSSNQSDASVDVRPIAASGETSVVVSWTDNRNGSDDIFFQRYDGNLFALGDQTQANITTENSDDESSVALDGAGNFVIAWTHEFSSTGGDDDIRFRRFSGIDGSGLTLFDQVTASPSGDQDEPVVSMSNDGRFVVAYEDDTNESVRYLEYDSFGNPIGFSQQYDVSQGFEDNPAIALNGNGSQMIIVADDDLLNSFDPTARVFKSTNQNNFIIGGSNNDIISGQAGNDFFDGRGGNDTINGGLGNDIMSGGADNDMLVGGSGNDTINGETGSDTVNYGSLGRAVTLLRAGSVSKGTLGTDTLSNVERIIGAVGFNNTINASSGSTASINANLTTNSLTINLPAFVGLPFTFA
nr:hypothetical protein [Hydrococcus sp. Prado102]